MRASPAQLAARNKNWAKFSIMGAIVNLGSLKELSPNAMFHLSLAIKHLKAAIKELP